jgi:hypothetical protein
MAKVIFCLFSCEETLVKFTIERFLIYGVYCYIQDCFSKGDSNLIGAIEIYLNWCIMLLACTNCFLQNFSWNYHFSF